MEPNKLKGLINKTAIQPSNNMVFSPKRDKNIRYFTKRDPHIFQRVIERDIDKNSFSLIFVRLFDQYHDDLLQIFDKDKDKMNSTDSVCLYVTFNGISVVFIVFDDDGFYSLMPLTVLDGYEYQKCDYEFTLK